MSVTFAILRDRLEQRRLWPHSRVAHGAWYTLGLALTLFLLQKIVAGFRISSGTTLGSWVTFLSFLSILFFVILAFRFLKAKVLWRLRNRLIVTYMFIAVVPTLLLVGMTVVTLYLLAGQFANFVVISEIRLQMQHVESVNAAIANELALRMDRGEPPTVALLDSLRKTDEIWKHRDVCAWNGSKPLPVCAEAQGKTPFSQPLFVKGPFSEIVRDHGNLFLRAARVVPVRNDKLTVVSSEVLDEALMQEISKNLGEITLYSVGLNQRGAASEAKQGSPTPPGPVSPNGAPASPADAKNTANESLRATFTVGTVPDQSSFLDHQITFGTPLSSFDWRTGEHELSSPVVKVTTRPSVLYDRLFATLGDFAKGVEAILLVIAIVLAIIELLALVIGTIMTRSITGAVAQLYRATQHIDKGDFSHRIPVKSTDQLAQLALSFNSMTASIEKLIIEQKEKQRMENELVIAQEVQAQLFPREISQLKSLEVHGFCRPARTVSGDYYDFLTISSDRMILAAGDVSGKGISAALLMATIHSAVRAYSTEGTPLLREPIAVGAGPTLIMASRTEAAEASPGALLSLLNHQLYESTPQEKYATLFLASYDGRSRKLVYSNGGHLPPILIGQDGALRRLDQGGMVVGLFDNLAFDEATVQLRPGDIFIAYSDGITEPENDFGEFGEQRLIDVISQNRDLPLHEITALVTSAVDDWIGDKEQPDDITLVLARAR